MEQRPKDQFDFYGGDMSIYMRRDQYDKLIKLSKGDIVTYVAKFQSFGGFIGTTFYLEDGILE